MKGTVSYRVVDAKGTLCQGVMPYPRSFDPDDSAYEDEDFDEDEESEDFDELDWTFRVRRHAEDAAGVVLVEPVTGTVEFRLVTEFEYYKCGTSYGAGKRTAANEAALVASGVAATPARVSEDAPIWRFVALYGVLDPHLSDPRLPCWECYVRCDPAQLSVSLQDFAWLEVSRRLVREGVPVDLSKLKVAVEETNLHIVTRDGVDVMEERPAPPDAPRVAGYAKD